MALLPYSGLLGAIHHPFRRARGPAAAGCDNQGLAQPQIKHPTSGNKRKPYSGFYHGFPGVSRSSLSLCLFRAFSVVNCMVSPRRDEGELRMAQGSANMPAAHFGSH